MDDEHAAAAAATQVEDATREGQRAGAAAELVLDNHRVVGALQYGGAPRRLVDVLNATDGVFVVIRGGVVENLRQPGNEPRRFDVLHVGVEAILFAIPRSGPPRPANTFELVMKVPSRATILLPGFEITGNVYLPPDADPTAIPLLASRHFVPLTDARVVAVRDREDVRGEPIVVVNLGRALVYVPGGLPTA